MLVSKNAKICVTSNANTEICITPKAKPQPESVESVVALGVLALWLARVHFMLFVSILLH